MRELRYFLTRRGFAPVESWLGNLKDFRGGLAVRTRLNRLADGNPGDWRPVGEGVKELRIHHGPGYRIYYAEEGTSRVILLSAGTKKTQDRDIHLAKKRWEEIRSES